MTGANAVAEFVLQPRSEMMAGGASCGCAVLEDFRCSSFLPKPVCIVQLNNEVLRWVGVLFWKVSTKYAAERLSLAQNLLLGAFGITFFSPERATPGIPSIGACAPNRWSLPAVATVQRTSSLDVRTVLDGLQGFHWLRLASLTQVTHGQLLNQPAAPLQEARLLVESC